MQYFSTEFSTVFLYSLLSGVLLFLVYELLFLLRILFKNSKSICIASDIIFMVTASLVTFIVSLAFNNGRVRFFICTGELSAFLILLFTIGAVTKKLFVRLLNTFRKWFVTFSNFFKKVTAKLLKTMQGLLYNKNG